MYKLFTDNNKTFNCNVDVSGVSLDECTARLILQTENINLLYEGEINRNGICTVNIKKIKKYLEENTKGKIKLEIVAENTLFTPWESDFIVEAEKKVKITEVNGQTEKRKNVSVIVENNETDDQINKDVEDAIFEREYIKKMDEHINGVHELMIKKNINNYSDFEKLFEAYKKVTLNKNVLTETELNYIKNKTKKLIN